MASTISPYCMFNRKLIDFIADLKPIIGHMPEYALVLSSVKMLDKIDERKNQAVFDRYIVGPYHDRINACDESFFLGSSYDGLDNVGVVQLIKSAWTGMSPQDKDAVWAHLRVLLVLSRRCGGVAAPHAADP